jgi:hypothetical protein
MPTDSVVQRNLEVGHGLVTGNTRENAKKVAGIIQALAKVRRPQNSVYEPLSTPPMPRIQPVIVKVRIANQRLTGLSARALQT